MPDPENPFTLIHVATAESHGVRIFPQEEPPDWAKGLAGEGDMSLRGWYEDHVLALLSTTIAREELAIRVTLAGLYQVDASQFVLEGGGSSSTDSLKRLADDAKQLLSEQALPDLYPFMRELVFRASAEIFPPAAIMLTPKPPQPGPRVD